MEQFTICFTLLGHFRSVTAGALCSTKLTSGASQSVCDDGIEKVTTQLPDVLSHYSRTVSKDDMSIAFML